MSLWLEHLNELEHYFDLRHEAEEYRLVHQGENGPRKTRKIHDRRQSLGLFVLFLMGGLLVFGVFSHYYPFYQGSRDVLGRIAAAGGFLALALYSRKSERLQSYWLIPFAFFTALVAISVDYYVGLSQWITAALGVEARSPAGLAIEKLESSLSGIVIVLVLHRMAGQNVASLYIRRGRWQSGLLVGAAAFALMTATLIPVTVTFFKGENLTWARLLTWTPWVLIFVLANASNEELLFRGLFIGKMEPFLGKLAANIATTIPFVFAHAYTGYATDQSIFLALQLLPLALVWCWLMQKTNSLWGSILFHAAMDLPVVVGIFSNL